MKQVDYVAFWHLLAQPFNASLSQTSPPFISQICVVLLVGPGASLTARSAPTAANAQALGHKTRRETLIAIQQQSSASSRFSVHELNRAMSHTIHPVAPVQG